MKDLFCKICLLLFEFESRVQTVVFNVGIHVIIWCSKHSLLADILNVLPLFSQLYSSLICKPRCRQRLWWFDKGIIRTQEFLIKKAVNQNKEDREILKQHTGTSRAKRCRSQSLIRSHSSSWLSQNWDQRVLSDCLEESFVSKATVIFPWLKKVIFLCYFPSILSPNACTTDVANRAVNTISPLPVKSCKTSMNAKQNAVLSPLSYLWAHLPPTFSCSLSQASQTRHYKMPQLSTTDLNCH